MKPEIFSDGKTVWVNTPDGCCIGRFSRFGIDIHRDVRAQQEGKGECLDCTHMKPTREDWSRFVNGMLSFHQVAVPNNHIPEFLR